MLSMRVLGGARVGARGCAGVARSLSNGGSRSRIGLLKCVESASLSARGAAQVALSLSCANLYGYVKCSRAAKAKARRELAPPGAHARTGAGRTRALQRVASRRAAMRARAAVLRRIRGPRVRAPVLCAGAWAVAARAVAVLAVLVLS